MPVFEHSIFPLLIRLGTAVYEHVRWLIKVRCNFLIQFLLKMNDEIP